MEEAKVDVRVLYGSTMGKCKGYASRVVEVARAAGLNAVDAQSMDDFEPEDLANNHLVVLVVATYENGTPPANAKFLYEWMEDASQDFRIGTTFLAQARFAVFGVGDSLYEGNYNVVSKQMEQWVTAMKGTMVCARGEGDNSISRDKAGTADSDLETWLSTSLQPALLAEKAGVITPVHSGPLITSDPIITEHQFEYDDGEEEEKAEEKLAEVDHNAGVLDMEDMGAALSKQNEEKKKREQDDKDGVLRPMINETIRVNLTKQGYKLIGSHSGVKLCRWTKAMLRGRGGCYKHTFYGIASYQCMEMTPSLACANKCVFCWRHHTNPVGKEWKWAADSPEMIIEESVAKHKQMVKQMRGVPGVKPERFKEAMESIKHCALSLVGEPIMYPHINKYLQLLHERGISSFMVTNAQFPDRIEILEPVTQLYISVDAANKQELKEVDRPIFNDFWERFVECMKLIREKQQRTVYRMTLVKGMNMTKVDEYAELIRNGRPTFIEIKGVTFCGELNASNMTMKNVPFHQEVRDFCKELCSKLGDNYELACEHVHSCCVLISDTKLKIDGQWHTWIDYPKFHELVSAYHKDGTPFGTMDYAAPTPAWAVFGAAEEGFDPEETRWRRKQKKGQIELDAAN